MLRLLLAAERAIALATEAARDAGCGLGSGSGSALLSGISRRALRLLLSAERAIALGALLDGALGRSAMEAARFLLAGTPASGSCTRSLFEIGA